MPYRRPGPCSTCGRFHGGRQNECELCRRLDLIEATEADALGPGRWVLVHGVHHWKPDPPVRLQLFDDLRRAHARYAAGNRDSDVVDQERTYQRLIKARSRAKTASTTRPAQENAA